MWHFKHVNSVQVKWAIELFNSQSTLNNLNANNQVSVINTTFMNTVTNFAPNETTTCNDHDLQ